MARLYLKCIYLLWSNIGSFQAVTSCSMVIELHKRRTCSGASHVNVSVATSDLAGKWTFPLKGEAAGIQAHHSHVLVNHYHSIPPHTSGNACVGITHNAAIPHSSKLNKRLPQFILIHINWYIPGGQRSTRPKLGDWVMGTFAYVCMHSKSVIPSGNHTLGVSTDLTKMVFPSCTSSLKFFLLHSSSSSSSENSSSVHQDKMATNQLTRPNYLFDPKICRALNKVISYHTAIFFNFSVGSSTQECIGGKSVQIWEWFCSKQAAFAWPYMAHLPHSCLHALGKGIFWLQ